MPIKTVLNASDVSAERKALQQTMLYKFKPRLIRTVVGGRNLGLGIRNPDPVEYRKEFLLFQPNEYVAAQIVVTDQDSKEICQLVMHGRIAAVHKASAIINGLGVVYEIDPDVVVGDPADVETYAPVYIGRRKLKYWVCIYDDLVDNKVIITPATIQHSDAVLDLGAGGRGRERLAEYLVTNLAKSTKTRQPEPYPGDKPTIEPIRGNTGDIEQQEHTPQPPPQSSQLPPTTTKTATAYSTTTAAVPQRRRKLLKPQIEDDRAGLLPLEEEPEPEPEPENQSEQREQSVVTNLPTRIRRNAVGATAGRRPRKSSNLPLTRIAGGGLALPKDFTL